MRLLIVGGGGMLGHKLWQRAGASMEAWATLRRMSPAVRAAELGPADRVIDGVDVRSAGSLEAALDRARPDAVVNCVGVVKQLAGAKDPVESIAINALFPHVLARACAARGARLIHISTDCVFDGTRGGYREEDRPDAMDLYGRSKALGEPIGPGCLTMRTSIIGRELGGTAGLVEWFLSRRRATADGYAGAVFSGFTTSVLADLILRVLAYHPSLEGLYHVSADPIDKLTLLTLLDRAFGAGVAITPRSEPRIDRSLDSSRFRAAIGFTPPAWETMVDGLAHDQTPYEALRRLQGETA